jgi:hypothetical protein
MDAGSYFPVCAFNLKKREERQMCCHCTNLAPMWTEDNRAKASC